MHGTYSYICEYIYGLAKRDFIEKQKIQHFKTKQTQWNEMIKQQQQTFRYCLIVLRIIFWIWF